MYDLREELETCKRMLDYCNIPYGDIAECISNTRAKARWGQCKRTPKGYSININVDLLDERNPKPALWNTLCHELLHSAPGCMNHSSLWQEYANRLNKEFFLKIARTSSCEEKGVTYHRENNKAPKYTVHCLACGHMYKYNRAGKVIQHPERFRCSCGGRLEVVVNR